jgi:two-component system cell cycle response regulator
MVHEHEHTEEHLHDSLYHTATTPHPKTRNSGHFKQMFEAQRAWITTLYRQLKHGNLTEEEFIAALSRTITAWQMQAQKYQHQAQTDYPTKLPNRKSFDTRYTQLIKRGKPFGLLLVDVDDLKGIDDTYGHMAGNSVLIQVGLRMVSQVHKMSFKQMKQKKPGSLFKNVDMVSKWGGDEFAILLDGMDKPEDLEIVAQRIRKTIANTPFIVTAYEKEVEIKVTVSIGGGIYKKQGREFFKEVDEKALFPAKKSGRDKIIILP